MNISYKMIPESNVLICKLLNVVPRMPGIVQVAFIVTYQFLYSLHLGMPKISQMLKKIEA